MYDVSQEYINALADPVKDYAEIYNKRSTFAKLWVKLGLRYFGDYVTAFLKLNAISPTAINCTSLSINSSRLFVVKSYISFE